MNTKTWFQQSEAITDLIARAEAAETRCARLEEARENANEACAKWETLGKLRRGDVGNG